MQIFQRPAISLVADFSFAGDRRDFFSWALQIFSGVRTRFLLEQLAEERGHAHAGALQLLIDDRRRARIVGLVEREAVLLYLTRGARAGVSSNGQRMTEGARRNETNEARCA